MTTTQKPAATRKPQPEQSRARYPDETGVVERDGVRIFWERYGSGDPTVFLLPTWSIVHSRTWKLQIPYLARHFGVLTCDPRGNGRSDRPLAPEAYREEEFAADALAVMDATGTQAAALVSLSRGAERALHLAAAHPERVSALVFLAPALPLPPAEPRASAEQAFSEPRDEYRGWRRFNQHYWLEHYAEFVQYFFSRVFCEPHSTKQLEDAVGWALETDAETLVASQLAPRLRDEAGVRELTDRVRCPVLVVHGHDDAVRPYDSGAALARLTGGQMVGPSGRGSLPPGSRPGEDQPTAPGLHRPAAADHGQLDPGPGPAPAGPVHLLADRTGPRPA